MGRAPVAGILRGALPPMARAAPIVAIVALALIRAVDPVDAVLPAGIWAVSALGLAPLVGRAALPLLCQGAFMLVGAYTYGWVSSPAPVGLAWPPLVALAAAVLAGGAVGVTISPLARVTGVRFAVASIAIGLLIQQAVRTGDWIPGANTGLLDVPPLRVAGAAVDGAPGHLALVGVVLVVATVAVSAASRAGTPLGRALGVLAVDDLLVGETGLDPRRLRRGLLVFSALLGGAAGAIHASAFGVVQPRGFDLHDSFLIAVAVMVGGAASPWGAVAGAALFELSGAALGPALGPYRGVLLAALLVVVMRWSPDGLVRATPRRRIRPPTTRPGSDPVHRGVDVAVRDVGVERAGVRALDGCTLHVGRGQLAVIVGPNGAGKSTLLGVIAGAVAADGTVHLDGVDVSDQPVHQRARAGVVTTRQHPFLCASDQVRDHVERGTDLRRRRRPSLAGQPIGTAEAVALVAPELAVDRPVASLDHAEVRIADLARLVAAEPSLALIDEPTAGLDQRDRQRTVDLIRELHRRGSTVIVAEHDLGVIDALDARVIGIAEGRVVADGSSEDVFTHPTFRTAYFGAER